MARRSFPHGKSVHDLLERASRPSLLLLLGHDDLAGVAGTLRPEAWSDATDIIGAVADLTRDGALPLQDASDAILRLAEGKGPTSLDTAARQHLDTERFDAYRAEPDELARSIWTWVHARRVFDDADAFRHARNFRGNETSYDLFEVEEPGTDLAAGFCTDDLIRSIREKLELHDAKPSISQLDLPATSTHPASRMMVVRHPSPLSSVACHDHDGTRRPLYFRPSNEAILIWTPGTRTIEVCAVTREVRHRIAECFARDVLGQNLSASPLKLRLFDLSRFRRSLELDTPPVEGAEILSARVTAIEVRLGNWSRRLALLVGDEDDIAQVADVHLGRSSVFRRAQGLSFLRITVRYQRPGARRGKTLHIEIRGGHACNLRSNRDSFARSLGYALMSGWGIMSTYRPLDPEEARTAFTVLADLHDHPEDIVTGAYLQARGQDPHRLVEAGILTRDGRDACIVLDDGADAEIHDLSSGPSDGTVTLDLPENPSIATLDAGSVARYAIARDVVQDRVAAAIRPVLDGTSVARINGDLVFLGEIRVDARKAPAYLARRLDDPDTLARADGALRARNQAVVGVVFCCAPTGLPCLGPNVVLEMADHLSDAPDAQVLDRTSIELAYRNSRSMAWGGTSVQLFTHDTHAGTLLVPGHPPLTLVGANPVALFGRLVDAHHAGSPVIRTGTLIEGICKGGPASAFRPNVWKTINGVYIENVAHGFWQLKT